MADKAKKAGVVTATLTIMGAIVVFGYYGAVGLSEKLGCQICLDVLTPFEKNLPALKPIEEEAPDVVTPTTVAQ